MGFVVRKSPLVSTNARQSVIRGMQLTAGLMQFWLNCSVIQIIMRMDTSHIRLCAPMMMPLSCLMDTV